LISHLGQVSVEDFILDEVFHNVTFLKGITSANSIGVDESLGLENSPVEVDYLYLSVVLCAYEDLGKLFHICKGKADKKCATGVFAFFS
jgi:hypothetical protein